MASFVMISVNINIWYKFIEYTSSWFYYSVISYWRNSYRPSILLVKGNYLYKWTFSLTIWIISIYISIYIYFSITTGICLRSKHVFSSSEGITVCIHFKPYNKILKMWRCELHWIKFACYTKVQLFSLGTVVFNFHHK